MSEETPKVIVAEVSQLRVVLPGSPYQMWLDGELDDYLHIPRDGTRVEIIDGEIVVSPAPRTMHNFILTDISDAIAVRRFQDREYRWRCYQNNGLNFIAEENGHIPDLVVMDTDMANAAMEARARHLVTDQAEMVVEVTSPSTATRDRPPIPEHAGKGKWCGYARAEIPYYLLVDLDPAVAMATLHSIPDQASAAYLHEETWSIGETIVLPDPLGLEIPTDSWKTWG